MSTFKLKFDNKTFDLPIPLIPKKSDYLNTLLLTQPENAALSITHPFTSEQLALINWLITQDHKTLISSISSLESLFQIYFLARWFKIKPYTNIRNILLSIPFTVDSFNFDENLTSALHKDHIDLHFLLHTLKNLNFSFGIDGKLVKIVLIFEWLGEKTCNNEDDLLKLENSEEIRFIEHVLVRENLWPNASQKTVLKQLFPNTFKFLGLD